MQLKKMKLDEFKEIHLINNENTMVLKLFLLPQPIATAIKSLQEKLSPFCEGHYPAEIEFKRDKDGNEFFAVGYEKQTLHENGSILGFSTKVKTKKIDLVKDNDYQRMIDGLEDANRIEAINQSNSLLNEYRSLNEVVEDNYKSLLSCFYDDLPTFFDNMTVTLVSNENR